MSPYPKQMPVSVAGLKKLIEVEGDPADIVLKIGEIYDKRGSKVEIQTLHLDRLTDSDRQKLATTGLKLEGLVAFYNVRQKQPGRNPIGRAVVLGYDNKPDISQIVPAYLDDHLLTPEYLRSEGFTVLGQ